MGTCFVIQPFDRVFDKRFEDVFAPAVKDAGLEPYRVDRDPSTTILIDSIEKGIRDANVCLADITTDNPNVWFELGFAFASGQEVVLVCSKERTTKFPFDVQHRAIISYATESSSDFEALQTAITERIRATVAKGQKLEAFASSPVVATEGLAPQEMVYLALIAENTVTPQDHVSPNFLKNDMERAGYTALASSLSLRSLIKKEMAETFMAVDYDSREEYPACRLTSKGEAWLLENLDKLVLRAARKGKESSDSGVKSLPPAPDEIPF